MKNHSHENAVVSLIGSPIWWPLLRFIFVAIMIALACIALATGGWSVKELEPVAAVVDRGYSSNSGSILLA